MKIKSFINTLFLIILILILLFVFYRGIENIDLKENYYGVVFTKTNGWKEELIEKEKFSWDFKKVIPTNYTLHQFQLEKLPLESSFNSILPSGALYAEHSGFNKNNFSYSFSLSTSIKFNKNHLSTYTQRGYFTDTTFKTWLNAETEVIKEVCNTFLKDSIEKGIYNNLDNELYDHLKSKFQHFYFDQLNLNLSLPDLELYKKSRERYLDYLSTVKTAEEDYIKESLEKENEHKIKLDLLKMYGEVFTQYPIMIEYIKADQNMLLDRASLEDFIAVPQNQN